MADSLNTNTNPAVRTRLVVFQDAPLAFEKISAFRGYVNKVMNWQEPQLHNHLYNPDGSTGEDYRYPLVQYRVVDGCAALFGLNEGCQLIENFINSPNLDSQYGQFADYANQRSTVGLGQQAQRYYIGQWAALNNANYEDFKNTPYLSDRVAMLERILQNHLKNFCNAIGYRYPDHALWVRILDCAEPQHKKFTSEKGKIPMLTFGLSYHSNLLMPNLLGMGRGKSKGFGVQLRG